MIKNTYIDVTIGGNTLADVLSLEVNEGFRQATSRFSLETRDISGIQLNENIQIDLGYDTDHADIFHGYIDSITSTRRPGIYEVVGRDILKRAIEHYIVTTDLENPWSRSNISAENLVRDLLAEAGITDYSGDASSFTFGVDGAAEFNLISSWDAIERICRIIVWECYALNGTVYFQDIRPVPSGVPILTLTTGNLGTIVVANYEVSTDNLRNKVIVFGKEGVYAEDSRADSYDPRVSGYVQLLPVGFYKTAIVSSELIDQAMADQAVTYNLELYNRLTEAVRLDVEGNYRLRARKTITASESFTGISGDWFIYSVAHRLDESGYLCTLHLTR